MPKSPLFKILPTAFSMLLLGPAPAAGGEAIPLEGVAWESDGGTLSFEDYAGRQALRLYNGEATMRGVQVENGVIEFDLAFENTRGFAGVIFRRPDRRDGENFYFRSHQSGNPDANQYTPLFNGSSAWQIYYGPQYAAPTVYRHGEWMHVTLIVQGDEAEVHLDDEPILHIDDLLRDPVKGGVSLWTNIAPAWFSNVSVSEGPAEFELAAAAPPTMPPGTITLWQVSEPFPWSRVARAERLDTAWMSGLTWAALPVERNGVANLSRVSDRAAGATVLARATLPPEHAGMLRFGFSDAVRAYVNETLVFEGDDTYGSRDYRFLGTVGLYDTLYTDPGESPVTFTFAVREGFGGWAVASAAPLSVPIQTEVDSIEDELGHALHETMIGFQRDGFSGALIAASGGKPVLEAGYGLADRAAGLPFTVDTVAQIGSITKAFTAMAIIDLEASGALRFDAPISRYLPAAAAPARAVTIHQLLTHSSGMPEYCGDDFERVPLKQFLRECMAQPLRFEPGTGTAYSNAGYSVLAAVVEAVSGRKLEAYLRDEILVPNGLETIGYAPPEEATLAHGYRNDDDQGVISDRMAMLDGQFWNLKGNGGMQASTRDMFGWYETLAGRRSLDQDLARTALLPRLADGESNWSSYGWSIGQNADGDIDRVSFAGSDGVFYSYFWWNPQTDRFFYLVGNAGEQRTIDAVRAVRRMLAESEREART